MPGHGDPQVRRQHRPPDQVVPVVSQMIAGSVARPELAPPVLAAMEPWLRFAEETIRRLVPEVLPASEVANAAVTFYLGVNLLSHLAPEDDRLGALFRSAERAAPLLASLPT